MKIKLLHISRMTLERTKSLCHTILVSYLYNKPIAHITFFKSIAYFENNVDQDKPADHDPH